MKTFKMIVSYDGSDYKGWQRQKDDVTVQGVIESSLKTLLNENIVIHGAGRTDAGVHSIKGQTASFRIETSIEPDKLKYALNRILPRSIYIDEITEANYEFHARYNAIGKKYCYIIKNNEELDPFRSRYVHHVDKSLNFEAIEAAMQYFVGTHDFSAFKASGSKIENSIRTIYSFTLERKLDEYHFTISGDGFLYNMIRIIMGTLLKVGEGKISPEDVPGIILSKDRSKARLTAPACGLYLMEVFY